jgi:hypothetical protein
MSNNLSSQLLAQLYGQESDIPLLLLITISHPDIDTIRLVNNTVDIVSRGNTFMAFPVKIALPPDDGETARELALELDNVSLELIAELRTVTSPMNFLVELVLASVPDVVQMDYGDLKLRSVTYNKNRVSGRLFMDNFLNTELTSEKYTPTTFPGLF